MERMCGQRAGTYYYKYGNYFYHSDSRARGRRFVCAEKSIVHKCRVKAFVHEDGSVEIVGGPHRHGPSTYEKRKPLIRELKRLAKETDHRPHIIVRQVYEEHRNAEKYLHRDTARQAVISERRKFLEPIPETLSQMAGKLERLEFARPIYRGHFTAPDGASGLVFSTDKMMEALGANGQELYIDGTFASRSEAPRSCQLRVLHIRKTDVGVPILFVICERKTKSLYMEFWKFLLGKIPKLMETVKYVISDFESALIYGTRRMLPNARIRGCWIHYIRATTRKWEMLNLPRCEDANRILGMIWAIPLVPAASFAEAINVTWEEVHKLQSYEEHEFSLYYEYMTEYWLKLADVVSMWECPVRINNISEAFNRHLPTKLGGERPKIYPFIEKLGGVLTDSEHLWEQLNQVGMVLNKGSRSSQLIKSQHIQHMTQSLQDNRFTMKDFLTGIFTYPQLNEDGIESLLYLDHHNADTDLEMSIKLLQDPPNLPAEKLGADYAFWQSKSNSENRVRSRARGRPERQAPYQVPRDKSTGNDNDTQWKMEDMENPANSTPEGVGASSLHAEVTPWRMEDIGNENPACSIPEVVGTSSLHAEDPDSWLWDGEADIADKDDDPLFQL